MPAAARLVVPIALAFLLSGYAVSVRPASGAGAPRAKALRVRATLDTSRTTMDGVYTLAQALKGNDVFAAHCRSCHTPESHNGPPFRNKWYGRTLAELFGYMRREMPKTEPGSLSDVDYAKALAYILRLNGMPTGSAPLSADSVMLQRIRLDSVPSAPSTQSPPR